MDVKAISSINFYASYEQKYTKQSKQEEKKENEAFEVEISEDAKKMQKGLSANEVDALKDNVAKSQEIMIQIMTEQNAKIQGWLDDGITKFNFDGLQIDVSMFDFPEVATTPEEAQEAISEGGQWSVNAVSDRIFGLAEALAGGDKEKLQQMREAVEEGFRQAGISWKNITDQDDMPQITKDTHDEIMKRFDKALMGDGNDV